MGTGDYGAQSAPDPRGAAKTSGTIGLDWGDRGNPRRRRAGIAVGGSVQRGAAPLRQAGGEHAKGSMPCSVAFGFCCLTLAHAETWTDIAALFVRAEQDG